MRSDVRMSEELSGDMIFDTSVLMELIIGSKGGRTLSKLLRADILRASTTEINVVELRYILCRKVGRGEVSGSCREDAQLRLPES